MAGEPTGLSEKQRSKAIAWLNSRAPNLTCPSCGHHDFAIGGHFLAPTLWASGSLSLGGSTYPMFFIVCNNCSHVMNYSAVSSGLIDVPAMRHDIADGLDDK